jgi:hypothetical protein
LKRTDLDYCNFTHGSWLVGCRTKQQAANVRWENTKLTSTFERNDGCRVESGHTQRGNNSYLTSCIPPPLPTKQPTECNSVERLITQETTGTPWQLVDISPPPSRPIVSVITHKPLSAKKSAAESFNRLSILLLLYEGSFFRRATHRENRQHIVDTPSPSSYIISIITLIETSNVPSVHSFQTKDKTSINLQQ